MSKYEARKSRRASNNKGGNEKWLHFANHIFTYWEAAFYLLEYV